MFDSSQEGISDPHNINSRKTDVRSLKVKRKACMSSHPFIFPIMLRFGDYNAKT